MLTRLCHFVFTMAVAATASVPAYSETNPASMLFPPDQWKTAKVPFGFKYGGKDSEGFIGGWQKSREAVASEGGEIDRQTFSDPATGLKVTAEVRTFKDYDAVEWVLRFNNEGKADTPIIADIEPLLATVPAAKDARAVLYFGRGSSGQQNDFEPQQQNLDRDRSIHLESSGGRSSDGTLPYFDLQVDHGGVIGAIGWTGNWRADFTRGNEGIQMSAGMQRTHLLLHPGEVIRTPRILILNWSGDDRDAAHNVWRSLLRTYYSPQENGKTLVGPACTLTWGNDLASIKLERIKTLAEKKVPFDVYWIDAGWYGNEDYHEGSTVGNTPWYLRRGSWWPNKQCYPDGFKPLGDLLHQNGMEFLLWIEPEEADKGSDLINAHPDWFFKRGDGGGLLNLGNSAARTAITDLVLDILAKGGLDWYRQDFNIAPANYWVDAPDRVGMTEIRYIEGLYKYWDDLRARHPGLKIDNCASGGRRLDLEMITRSMSLWRSDYCCGTTDSIGPESQTVGLSPWIPLSAGCCEGNTTYALRSAYSPGLVVDGGCNILVPKDDAWLKAGLEEFHEVRQYFYGDFYALLPFNLDSELWGGVQFDRPDLKGGVAIFTRRPTSPFSTIDAHLRTIDPAASYSVEVRTELGPGVVKTMRGAELTNLAVTIPTMPGSALVIYKRL